MRIVWDKPTYISGYGVSKMVGPKKQVLGLKSTCSKEIIVFCTMNGSPSKIGHDFKNKVSKIKNVKNQF